MAVEQGAKSVILLEKRFATGGDALRANWIFAVESPLQEAAGVTITADDIYKTALEFHRYDRVRPRILRVLIKRTGPTVQWLTEKGVEFDLRGMGPDPKTATSHWLTRTAGNSLPTLRATSRSPTGRALSPTRCYVKTSGKS